MVRCQNRDNRVRKKDKNAQIIFDVVLCACDFPTFILEKKKEPFQVYIYYADNTMWCLLSLVITSELFPFFFIFIFLSSVIQFICTRKVKSKKLNENTTKDTPYINIME